MRFKQCKRNPIIILSLLAWLVSVNVAYANEVDFFIDARLEKRPLQAAPDLLIEVLTPKLQIKTGSSMDTTYIDQKNIGVISYSDHGKIYDVAKYRIKKNADEISDYSITTKLRSWQLQVDENTHPEHVSLNLEIGLSIYDKEGLGVGSLIGNELVTYCMSGVKLLPNTRYDFNETRDENAVRCLPTTGEQGDVNETVLPLKKFVNKSDAELYIKAQVRKLAYHIHGHDQIEIHDVMSSFSTRFAVIASYEVMVGF